jgi:hypothetical protein
MEAGLPEDICTCVQAIPLWIYFEGLGMKNVGIFTVIWNILQPFDIFCD